MKVEPIHNCSYPKCKKSAVSYIVLDNGARALKVCDSHLQWGMKTGQAIEDS